MNPNTQKIQFSLRKNYKCPKIDITQPGLPEANTGQSETIRKDLWNKS
jgi:hypothetical protein